MLELYYQYPKVLRRLRTGALGGVMDRIAADLCQVGYTPGSAKIYLERIAQFGRFATRFSGAGAVKISPEVVTRFLKSRKTTSVRLSSQTAIGQALRLVPERFDTKCGRKTSDAKEPLLGAYLQHLQQVRGLQPRTCEGRLLVATRLLRWYRRHVRGGVLATMSGEHVLAVIHHLVSLSSNDGTRASIATHVRSFLRFLQWAGVNKKDLARFVPRTPCWRLSHIPPRLSWRDMRRAIDAIETISAIGMRDRAVLLLLATTGLRNKELRGLELRDLHWAAGEVHVRWTKSHRDRVVPLLPEAGAALAKYVLHGRPKIAAPQVFLCHRPPVRPIGNSSIIARIVRRRLEQSGIKLARAGAHLVRHSLATQLVRQKRPIKEVADQLGHQSIDTTAIYVKVALPQLMDVALPFPGGQS